MNGAGLRTVAPLLFAEADLRANAQGLEGLANDGVFVKIDFASIVGADEAAVFFGKETFDNAMGLGERLLGLINAGAHMVLQLPTQGAEDIPQRDIGVFMALCRWWIAAGGETHSPWQLQGDAKRVEPTLVVAVARAFDAHFAGGNAAVALLKGGHFALNAPPQEVRRIHTFKNDMKGGFHECLIIIVMMMMSEASRVDFSQNVQRRMFSNLAAIGAGRSPGGEH